MTLLPVAARELLAAARQPRTYWLRVVFVLAAIALAAYLLFILRMVRMGGGAPGKIAFDGLGSLGFLVCAVMGALSTADAISAEKREGTLGFLFLTDLKPFDILMGKLAASSLWLLHLLLAAIPALTIPILQGGVTAFDVVRQALVLVNMAFFSGALGLLVSTGLRDFRRARSLALVFVAAALAGPSLLAVFGRYQQWPPWLLEGIATVAPSAAQANVASGPSAWGGGFWWPVVVTHLGGWLALALAAWLLPRVWQDRPAGPRRARWQDVWRQVTEGGFEARRSRRQLWLDRNAFYWLAARRRFRGVFLWMMVATFIGLVGHAWLRAPLSAVMAFALWWTMLHVTLKFWLAADAAEPIAAQRREGSLELLLSTPLGTHDIIAGHWTALRRQFAGPLALAVGGNLLAVVALGLNWIDADQVGDARSELMAVAAASAVMLVADGIALGWCGLWRSIATRQVRRASGEAVTRILFVPWLLLAAGLVGVVLGGWTRAVAIQPRFWPFLGAWLVVGLATDAVFSFWSRRQFLARFRHLAAERFTAGSRSDFVWSLRWRSRPGPARRSP